jgi:hypothetical protein
VEVYCFILLKFKKEHRTEIDVDLMRIETSPPSWHLKVKAPFWNYMESEANFKIYEHSYTSYQHSGANLGE